MTVRATTKSGKHDLRLAYRLFGYGISNLDRERT